VIVRHQDRGALRLDHLHNALIARPRWHAALAYSQERLSRRITAPPSRRSGSHDHQLAADGDCRERARKP
jgi:hypothetical protein